MVSKVGKLIVYVDRNESLTIKSIVMRNLNKNR